MPKITLRARQTILGKSCPLRGEGSTSPHITVREYFSVLYKDPEHWAMTAIATAIITMHGVESMLKTFKEGCPERTQEIIGRKLLNPVDLLEIQ
jgi:hypothetical protein